MTVYEEAWRKAEARIKELSSSLETARRERDEMSERIAYDRHAADERLHQVCEVHARQLATLQAQNMAYLTALADREALRQPAPIVIATIPGPALSPSSTPREPAREPDAPTAWLIEKPEPGGVYWLANRSQDYRHGLGWVEWFTTDASAAIRFESQADAEAVRKLLPEWREIMCVTEHMWCPPARDSRTAMDAPATLNQPPRFPKSVVRESLMSDSMTPSVSETSSAELAERLAKITPNLSNLLTLLRNTGYRELRELAGLLPWLLAENARLSSALREAQHHAGIWKTTCDAHVLVINEDLEPRIEELESALRLSEERGRELSEAVRDAVAILDDGLRRWLSVNFSGRDMAWNLRDDLARALKVALGHETVAGATSQVEPSPPLSHT